MLNNKTIGFIGAGNMAETLLSGLISSNQSKPENITCSDVRQTRLAELAKQYGIKTTTDNKAVIGASEIIVYAVKPQIMAEVFKETADILDLSKLIISIAAGVPLAAIEALVRKDLRLIRAMPNDYDWCFGGGLAQRLERMPEHRLASQGMQHLW